MQKLREINSESRVYVCCKCFHEIFQEQRRFNSQRRWRKVVENMITLKKLRKINSIVTSLVTLIWRKNVDFSVKIILTFYSTFSHYFCNVLRCLHTISKPKLIRKKIEMNNFTILRKVCKRNANSTPCSQAVTHPSTDGARRCLTSVIGRELVYSAWYGRWQK